MFMHYVVNVLTCS